MVIKHYTQIQRVQNTANGSSALRYNTTGSNNVANGYQSLLLNTTGEGNVANGFWSLRSNTTGSQNVANGYQSLYANTTGNNNVVVGYQALRYNTTGSNNVATGTQSLYKNTTGDSNVSNGISSLYNNTTGNFNTANGSEALYSNTIGFRNTAFGYQTLRTNVDDNGLTAIGYSALYSNNGGGLNTAVGYQALYSNTVANENTAVGSSTLGLTVGGGRNTAVGSAAMLTNVGGSNNLALGTDALRNATANSNTAVGSYSLRTNINGSNNVAVGKDSGTFLSNGTTAVTATTNGVFIGSGTSPAANGQNNQIVIGYQAIGIGSNSVVIGNDSITKTLLKGNVGIGTTSLSEKLNVSGNILATGTITGSNLSGTNTGDQDLSGYLLNTTVATNTTLGLIELFSNTDQTVAANAVTTTAGRTYGLQLNSANQGVINVPWTDTNTTYTAGTGLALTGTVFSNTITNNNQLTNGAGYITDGNTGWNNTYGFITASSTDTLTNKSGNISQWTNDSGYTTNVGDITGVTAGTGLSGGGTSGTVTLTNSAPNVSTNLSTTTTATTVTIVSSDGTDASIPAATTSVAGVMTGADKTKLNGIASGAEVNVQSDWNAASGDALILNKPTVYAEPGIFSGGGTPTLASGVTGAEVRSLIGAGTGDITGVTAGTNLTGGGTSGSVTLNMATGGVGAGTYGSTAEGTKIDTIAVDAYGRVTGIALGYNNIGASGFEMNDGAQIKTYQDTNSGSSQSAATLITESVIDMGGSINWWSEVQNGSYGTYNHAVFYHGTSQAGAIRRSGNTTVSYITSSDYRLKENVVEITDGIERVKQLKPSKFNFIGEDRIVDGFLAHEVQEL
jgi:hypothetical protein